MMTPYLLACIIVVSIVHLCIGTSVFLKAPRDRTNQLFYLAIITMVVWMLFNTVGTYQWQQVQVKTILTRFAYATGMLAGGAVASFCLVFANKNKPPRKPLVFISAVCALFVVLSFFPGAILKEFRASGSSVIEVHGPLRIPFYVTLAVLFFYGLLHLWRRRRATEFGEERFQLALLGTGIFIPAIVSLTALAVIPSFVPTSQFLSSVGPISTVAFILLAGYATLKQGHFIEVDLALKYVFDGIAAGICVTRSDGQIIRHNRGLIELLGYEGKLAGQSIEHLADLLEPDLAESPLSLRTFFEAGRPDSIQITLSGLRNKTLDLTASRLTNSTGRPLGKVFLFHDVTERKKLKEEIRESEEKYRMLVENADDVIYTVDLDGNFTFFNNKAAEKITGYRIEEWLGKNYRDLAVPGEEERIIKHAREAYKGTPQRYETKIFHKTGRVLTLWNFLSPMMRDNKVVGFSVVARDITETKRLQRQVRESEEKYRTLVEESENTVYIIQDGRLKFVNKVGLEMSGFTEEELYREDFDLLRLIHPDDRLAAAEAMAALVGGDFAPQRLEVRLVSKQGEVNDFILTGTSLAYQGKPAIMGVLVDMTEKKKLQEQLIQSEKLVSIGQLVSGVAHELNNPLAAIMGYAELFSQSKTLSLSDRDTARKIFESSGRCKRIIQNLLSFARKQEIRKVNLDVNEVLEKAIELREYNLKSHDIKVLREYQADLRTTVGDPQQLQSVFLNLINNAGDAMGQSRGKGTLRIATRMEGENIIAEFGDDGPGIPPEFRDRIFDPFFTTKEVGKGTGLGLSISYGIIREHGGELILDKSYDGGSSFMVKLPAGKTSRDDKPAAAAVYGQSRNGSKPKILVVDDEEMILDLSVDILTGNGYEVETARTGETARDMIESNSYDLIIADIRMPGSISGIGLFNWAKQNKAGTEEKIVFATGDVVADETQKFLAKTKRPCLAKPFELSDYLDTVQKALAASPNSAALPGLPSG